MWQSLMDQLSSNQFLSGGALLAVVGVIFTYLRRVPSHIWDWTKRRLITVVDVPDRDEAFKWLNVWLAQHPYQKRCRLWTVQTKRQRNENDIGDSNLKKPQVILSPAPGLHFLFYRHRLMILRRERREGGEKGSTSGTGALGFYETFNFTLFSRNKQIVLDLLEEARQVYHPPLDARVTIASHDYGSWIAVGKRLPRPMESVILADGLADRILEDIRRFQKSESWYNDRGIPYRRGYLLHGAPGNGKSSLVIALASTLQFDIYTLNLSSHSLSNEGLLELMSSIPTNSMILIEDIDCVFLQRKKADDKESVTFSGLLNAIDGVMASEGRILFMTTNHVETLDPALIRPGRVDLSLELANASRDQMERLFLRFFPLPEVAKKFAERGDSNEWSMATLQGHLLKYRDDPISALTNPIFVS
jgi:chaperone BCS1